MDREHLPERGPTPAGNSQPGASGPSELDDAQQMTCEGAPPDNAGDAIEQRPGRSALRAALIAVVVLIAYVPAMRSGFIWDDEWYLTDNPMIRASNGLYRFWFTTEPQDYYPLPSTMLWIEWRLWGMNAAGYHVVNVLLHAVSAVLVWRVLERLRIPGAWLAGLIYGVHPVCVESVAWIAERKNTLPMGFFLLAILLYLRYERQSQPRWYWLAAGAFLLALLSKTSVVMLPVVLLGLAWWQRGRIDRQDVIRSGPFFALSIAFGLITVWFQYHHSIGPDAVREGGLASRLAVAGTAVWFYLGKALLPVRLTHIYPGWELDPGSLTAWMPLIGLAAGLLVCWRFRRSWGRPILAGAGFFVVNLLPVLGLVDIYFLRYSVVADRWQYVSLVGIIALASGAAVWAARGGRPVVRAAGTVGGVAVVGVLAVLTWRQSRVYHDPQTLWEDTLAKNPSAWVAHASLADTLMQRGDIEAAREHLEAALAIQPDSVDARFNMGLLMARQGHKEEAIRHLRRASQNAPRDAQIHQKLGTMLLDQGLTEEAVVHLTEACRISPKSPQAHHDLAAGLAKAGKVDEAIEHYQQAVRLNPSLARSRYELGCLLMDRGRYEEAAEQLEAVVRMEPFFTEAAKRLNEVNARRKRPMPD